MGIREGIMDCLAAKAEALYKEMDKTIKDPVLRDRMSNSRKLSHKKVMEYRDMVDDLLSDPALKGAEREEISRWMNDLVEADAMRTKGLMASLDKGQLAADAVRELASKAANPGDVGRMPYYTSPALRDMGLEKALLPHSIEDMAIAYEQQYSAIWSTARKTLSQEASVLWKSKSKPTLEAFAKRMFGEIGDEALTPEAKALVKAATLSDEYTLARFHDLNIPVKARNNYMLSAATFNKERVGLMSFDSFKWKMKEGIQKGYIDAELLQNHIKGPMTEAKGDEAFEVIFNEITGRKASPTKFITNKGALLHKSREFARVLNITSYEGMKWFDGIFGYDNIGEKIRASMSRNSRTLAMLETMGPDRTTYQSIVYDEIARLYGPQAAADFAHESEKALKFYGGAYQLQVSDKFAKNLAGAQQIAASSALAGQSLGAISQDFAVNTTRNAAKLGQSVFRPTLETFKKLFSSIRHWGSGEHYRDGLYLSGALADTFNEQIKGLANQTNRTIVGNIGATWYEGVQKLSMIRPITNMARDSSAVMFNETLHTIANGGDLSTTLFSKLLNTNKAGAHPLNYFKSMGLSAEDIKLLQPYFKKINGAWVLDTTDIPITGRVAEVNLKVKAAQGEYIRTASPISAARLQANVAAIKGTGKTAYTAASMLSMFTGWLGDNYMRNIAPTFKKKGMDFITSTGVLLSLMTMSGLVQGWLQNLVRGEDPEDVTPASIGKALLRSGVFNKVGDIVGSGLQGQKRPVLDSPMFALGTDAFEVTAAGIAGDKEKTAGKAVDLALDVLPGGNTFFSKIPIFKAYIDALRMQVDPVNTMHHEQARQRRLAKEGRGQYWTGNDALPERAPKAPEVKLEG